jgi:hypothetical protein
MIYISGQFLSFEPTGSRGTAQPKICSERLLPTIRSLRTLGRFLQTVLGE